MNLSYYRCHANPARLQFSLSAVKEGIRTKKKTLSTLLVLKKWVKSINGLFSKDWENLALKSQEGTACHW